MVWDWELGCRLSATLCEEGLTSILPPLIRVI